MSGCYQCGLTSTRAPGGRAGVTGAPAQLQASFVDARDRRQTTPDAPYPKQSTVESLEEIQPHEYLSRFGPLGGADQVVLMHQIDELGRPSVPNTESSLKQ